MNKLFNEFADSGPGSWLIMVLAVIAGIILFKIGVVHLPDNGVLGAIKAAVNMV